MDDCLKTYYELNNDLQEQAREMHPTDFVNWFYKTAGAYIEWSAQ